MPGSGAAAADEQHAATGSCAKALLRACLLRLPCSLLPGCLWPEKESEPLVTCNRRPPAPARSATAPPPPAPLLEGGRWVAAATAVAACDAGKPTVVFDLDETLVQNRLGPGLMGGAGVVQ
eukprot:gene46863-31672_t